LNYFAPDFPTPEVGNYKMKKTRQLHHLKNLPIICIVLLALVFTACTQQKTSPPVQSAEYECGGKLMVQKKVQLTSKQADGYVISLGQINLVFVATDKGMVGCGAFDVAALNNFGYPAAKVKSRSGKPIATIDDLLDGIVKEANDEAAKLGVTVGMSGREALDLM
jgi:uncharacterized protein YunC (DUF1805 family)